MKTGIELIAEERARGISVEGWTPEHDDEHQNGELAKAAVCYADFGCVTEKREVFVQLARGLADPESFAPVLADVPVNWPLAPEWWRPVPNDRIRELVKAGALIAAEIDRLDRQQRSEQGKA